MSANPFTVVLYYVLHNLIILSQEVQQVVPDQEVIARAERLQSVLGVAKLAFLVDEESIAAIGATWVEPL